MVMGPTHAMSGAAGWLVLAPLIPQVTDVTLTPAQTLTGAAICAGAALLPDIDTPSSTVSRSFGPLTQLIAYGVSAVSSGVYAATRSRRDDSEIGGHRKLTHTLVGALLAAAGVAALCGWGGKPAVIGLLFFLLGLAVRGLMADWAKRAGWVVTTLVAAGGAGAAYVGLPDGSYAWLAVAVFVGVVLHCLGDMITREGAPLTWPIPVRGRRWFEWAPPGFLRIRAGGLAEYALVLPACTLLTVAAVAALALGGWDQLLSLIPR